MELTLKRDLCTSDTTFGKLYINNVFFCETLEDADHYLENGLQKKIAGKTAIPRGHYDIDITWSNRFKKEMMLVKDVPQFSGIRIHAGNTHHHTEGCILLGFIRGKDCILNSRMAVDRLFPLVQKALKAGEEVSITIQ